METLRSNQQNQLVNPGQKRFAGNNALRKPLRVVGNIRSVSVKESFKEKTNLSTAKENICQGKSFKPLGLKPKLVAKKEVLPSVKEEKKVLPLIEAFSTIRIPDHIEKIDEDDKENPQLVSCFINEIYAYMRKLETIYPIKEDHLKIQSDITGKMRAVLVDWLVQVHLRFHLIQETLFMTISVLDRFLQLHKVKRSELQLVGVTCMFIASKYEEMYAPDISDFIYITDNTYSKQDILRMEKVILKTLEFNMSKPLPLHFLRRNSKAGDVDALVHNLAKYLMELALTEYTCAHYLPSLLAAAALYLSLRIINSDVESPWTETLEYYSSYTEDQIKPVVQVLYKLLGDAEKCKLQAVRTKYSSSKVLKVSHLPQLKSQLSLN